MRTSLVIVAMAAALAPLGAPAHTSAAVPPRCHGIPATIVGTPGDDTLAGRAGRDVIVGLGGNDRLVGKSGSDVLCGGRGRDLLSGGQGDDRLYGGNDRLVVDEEGSHRLGDVLQGGGDDDLLAPGLDRRRADDVERDLLDWSTSHTSPELAVTIDLSHGVSVSDFFGRDRLVGTGYAVRATRRDDTVRGSRRDDVVETLGGHDVVHGRAGNDRISVDDFPGGAADRAFGGPGDDWLDAFDGPDLLRGGDGADIVSDFGANADRLHGGPGPDRLADQLWDDTRKQVLDGGQGGADVLLLLSNLLNPDFEPATAELDLATGVLTYDGEIDTTAAVPALERVELSTDGVDWLVRGTAVDNDVSAAGSSSTTFRGRGGDDVFSGSAGDDVYDGGAGTDRARTMGGGDDRCISVELFDDPLDQDCEQDEP